MGSDLTSFDFQAWLDTVTGYFMAGDFDAFADTTSLPATVWTAEGASVISTRKDLLDRFEFWMRLMKAQQATDMIRTMRSSTRLGPDIIRGKYETELLRRGTRVIDPFQSEMMLRREDGVWRTISLEHSLMKQFWALTP